MTPEGIAATIFYLPVTENMGPDEAVEHGAQLIRDYTTEKLFELLDDLMASDLHNAFDLGNRKMELNKYGTLIQQYKK